MTRKRSRRKWTAPGLLPEYREAMSLAHNSYQETKREIARVADAEIADAKLRRLAALQELEERAATERKNIVDLNREALG